MTWANAEIAAWVEHDPAAQEILETHDGSELEEALQDHVRATVLTGERSLAQDLLEGMLQDVSWREVVQHLQLERDIRESRERDPAAESEAELDRCRGLITALGWWRR